MKTLQINDRLTITLRDGFKPTPIHGRNAWIEALRSGKYKQGKQSLRNVNDEYCCLGVKRDLEGAKWELNQSAKFYADRGYFTTYRGTEQLIDDLANLNNATLTLNNNIVSYSLASLNDYGATFEDIACVIEIYYEEAPVPTTAT